MTYRNSNKNRNYSGRPRTRGPVRYVCKAQCKTGELFQSTEANGPEALASPVLKPCAPALESWMSGSTNSEEHGKTRPECELESCSNEMLDSTQISDKSITECNDNPGVSRSIRSLIAIRKSLSSRSQADSRQRGTHCQDPGIESRTQRHTAGVAGAA